MNWPLRTLDELGFVGRGRSRHRPRNAASLYGGDYPFIQTADITAADYEIRSYSQTYNETGLAQSKLWDTPTLCMTIAGENTAETAILNFPACFPDSIVGFVPDAEKADIRFVKYALDQMKRRFRSVSKGATQDNLSLSKLLSFPLSIPTIEYQKRVVSVVSSYELLVDINARRAALLERAARLMFREWFVYLRFPGHEHVEIVRGVPAGWSRIKIGDVATIKKGTNITKDTVRPGNIPVVAGGLVPAYFHDTPNAKAPVVTVSGSGANAGFVNIYHRDIWASDCSYLDAGHNGDVYFLYLMLKEKQKEITAMQQGAAQPHVYPKDIMRLEIVYPSKQIREAFSEYVSPQFQIMRMLEQTNEACRAARDVLLPRIMDGRIEI